MMICSSCRSFPVSLSTVCLDRLHTFEVLLTEVTAVSPVSLCGVHVSPWTGSMGINPLTLRADML